jgi:Putative transposase
METSSNAAPHTFHGRQSRAVESALRQYRGFTLHANVAIPAADRLRLERLFRYCARPPIVIQRLELLGDGRILYRFKRPWRDGTTHIVFGPLEMIEKLSAVSEGVARLSGTPAGGPRGPRTAVMLTGRGHRQQVSNPD